MQEKLLLTPPPGILRDPALGREHRGGNAVIYRFRHGEAPVDGYTIQRGVGRGGFGEVYYALSDAGREVALKLIYHNEEIELRGVGQCLNLKSPNLVNIFDVRTAKDGTPCVIMEYVTGPSLRELIRRHPQGMGAQKSAYLVMEIAKGLGYLHDRGIVHRDLKPENIFYEDGYVKIGDYGLAKLIHSSQPSGQTISVGTVHYMAPEIGTGQYHKGIDLYALGVILHELLTGKVPFDGDSFGEILMKHLTQEPDLSGVSEPFRAAIAGALQKEPSKRFASVGEMLRGVTQDHDVHKSVASFDPSSLTQVADKFWRAPPEDREPARPFDSAEALARTTPTPQRQAAGPAPHADGARELPDVIASRAEAAGRALGTKLRKLQHSWNRLVSQGFARPDPSPRSGPSGQELTPGPKTRFFWVFLGSGLVTAALSCTLAPFVMRSSYVDETFAFMGCGIALAGFASFSFYRGVWARKRTFWQRSLKPFLVVTTGSGAAIGVVGFLVYLSMPVGYGRDEALVLSAVCSGLSLVLLGLVLTTDRMIARWSREALSTPPSTPPHERPVPIGLRIWNMLLASVCASFAVPILGVAIIERHNAWDLWAIVGCAVGFGALGAFFLRQALRPRRGLLWQDTMRPFLKFAVSATLVICALPFLFDVPMHGDGGMVVVFIASLALGFAVPLVILRGPPPKDTDGRRSALEK